jgi:hypothetical protein
MSVQGFILVKLTDPSDEGGLWELARRYESVDGIDRAARVIGPYDFVLTVDTTRTFEQVQARIDGEQAGEVLGLKTSDTFVRHREMQDLKLLEELISPQE